MWCWVASTSFIYHACHHWSCEEELHIWCKQEKPTSNMKKVAGKESEGLPVNGGVAAVGRVLNNKTANKGFRACRFTLLGERKRTHFLVGYRLDSNVKRNMGRHSRPLKSLSLWITHSSSSPSFFFVFLFSSSPNGPPPHHHGQYPFAFVQGSLNCIFSADVYLFLPPSSR